MTLRDKRLAAAAAYGWLRLRLRPANGSQMAMLAASSGAEDGDWLAVPAMPIQAVQWPIDFVKSLGARSIACKFSPNPFRMRGPGRPTNKKKNYDRYVGATTVRDFFASGGTAEDLRNHVANGFCATELDIAEHPTFRAVARGYATELGPSLPQPLLPELLVNFTLGAEMQRRHQLEQMRRTKWLTMEAARSADASASSTGASLPGL